MEPPGLGHGSASSRVALTVENWIGLGTLAIAAVGVGLQYWGMKRRARERSSSEEKSAAEGAPTSREVRSWGTPRSGRLQFAFSLAMIAFMGYMVASVVPAFGWAAFLSYPLGGGLIGLLGVGFIAGEYPHKFPRVIRAIEWLVKPRDGWPEGSGRPSRRRGL